MANEIQIRSSLNIKKGTMDYRQPWPTGYNASLVTSVPNGPTPGSLAVPLAGVNVSLAQLTTPGWCNLYNLGSGNTTTDLTCWVEIGVFDPSTGVHEFIPLLELLPGQGYPVLLSRFLGQEFGTATGTASTGTNSVMRLKSVGAVQRVVVDCFEK